MWENTKNLSVGYSRLLACAKTTPEQLDLENVAVESKEGRPPSIGTVFREKVAEVDGDEALGRRSFVG